MRVLMTGATGFIGRALARALLAQGHELVCAVRDPARLDLGRGAWRSLRVDLATLPDAAWWQPHLEGMDAVINAVGIIREQPGQSFESLHARAPTDLFRAAAAAGVKTVLQISALGADDEARSRYHRTKKAADDVLRSLPVCGAVIQPSIVYGASSPGAVMFNTMAAAPLLALPEAGAMQVQPVHVEDLVAGVLALLDSPPAQVMTFAFVGPHPMAMADYLRGLRVGLGLAGRLPVLALPTGLFMAAAKVAAHVPGSMLDEETAGMLLRGNAASADGFQNLLGRAPRDVMQFNAPDQVPALRAQAVMGLWHPGLRVSLALAWLGTAVALLSVSAVAALLALGLGTLTLVCPPAWRRRLWLVQGGLVVAGLLLAMVMLRVSPLLAWGFPVLAVIGLLWGHEPAALAASASGPADPSGRNALPPPDAQGD